jgi:putative ABC transport system permease protein
MRTQTGSYGPLWNTAVQGPLIKWLRPGTKVGPQFKRLFPEIQEYARTFISHNVVKSGDKLFDEPRILYADQPFFKIFSFQLLEGDAATALDAPDKIVLTRSMAKKYFGTENALNKILTSGGKDLKVSAVLRGRAAKLADKI